MLLVQKGCLNLFSLANDKDNLVKIIIDQSLLNCNTVTFHPMQNDALIENSVKDMQKYLTFFNKTPEILNFKDLPNEPEEKKEGKKEGKPKKEKPKKTNAKENEEEKSQLGLDIKKSDDISAWYTQILKKAELIEYCTDISGCYVFRPYSYRIWEFAQSFLDAEFKAKDVQNAYFPLFVSKAALEKEKTHLTGFQPEVAWVTKSGETDLPEPIAIRPTSETIMYPFYAKWIRSHRDLPLLLNQWTNIVRWEFKDPTPFIRSREFLWQEGHTAHASKEEGDKMVYDILDVYEKCYNEVMAVPVIKGIKTFEETFPGALYTTSVEAIIPVSGRGCQAATSHHLGQNFSKIFDIVFENTKAQKEHAWQTSWGFTTRSIGIMILTHSDDKGAVIPPRAAPIQVVFVPIIIKDDKKTEAMLSKCNEMKKILTKIGVRAHIDDRDIYSPGWKFNHWELKGVPIRIELGPKDLEKSEVRLVRRDNNEKLQVSWNELEKTVLITLESIQKNLFEKAKQSLQEIIKNGRNWEEFVIWLKSKKCVLTPFCDETNCEVAVKKKAKETETEENTGLGIKVLNKPLNQKVREGDKCFFCGKEAKCIALWGRSY